MGALSTSLKKTISEYNHLRGKIMGKTWVMIYKIYGQQLWTFYETHTELYMILEWWLLLSFLNLQAQGRRCKLISSSWHGLSVTFTSRLLWWFNIRLSSTRSSDGCDSIMSQSKSFLVEKWFWIFGKYCMLLMPLAVRRTVIAVDLIGPFDRGKQTSQYSSNANF